jgi:Xaa-Pro aminopeptidase
MAPPGGAPLGEAGELAGPLAPMAVAERTSRLRVALAATGCDALVVTHLTNVRYLTGFTGSAGLALVAPDGLVVLTDGRYEVQVADQLAAAGVAARVEVVGTEASTGAVVASALEGCGVVGLEADHVSWARQREVASSWLPDAELVPTSGLVEDLRLVKDPGELDRLARAAAIADAALARVRPSLAEGPTERQVALALEVAMRELGADGPSFETIVASGPNGARPHARPSERRIAHGDLVVIDFGALLDGYHSDMTRTIAVGRPGPTEARMLEVVTAAQAAGVAAVRAGAPASDVDRACRRVIEEAGWGEAFVHATGHGVGLDIHEAPRVGATSHVPLAEGQVVTVEPGVYLPDHGGVRVEDTLVVTATGARAITLTTKASAP